MLERTAIKNKAQTKLNEKEVITVHVEVRMAMKRQNKFMLVMIKMKILRGTEHVKAFAQIKLYVNIL